MEEGRVFMTTSNNDIAERLEALIAARRSLGIAKSVVIRRAINTIKMLHYNLSEYYHKNKDLPPDLKREVRKTITRRYIAYSIVRSDLADKIYEAGQRLSLSRYSKRNKDSLKDGVEKAIYNIEKEQYRAWEETLEREEPSPKK
ncbi:MAG: hypothetical protein AABY07_05680 [Nanoarchaeota archaeon]